MNPFDWRTVLLARHAQHVALIHFPIALYILAVLFDVIGYWTEREDFATVAYFNFIAAAVAVLPAAVTGLIAWQWALEGHRLRGILLMHFLGGLASTAAIWLTLALQWRARRYGETRRPARFALEAAGVLLVTLTGHLGGFLSGVNGGP